jgi:hypothetical protein
MLAGLQSDLACEIQRIRGLRLVAASGVLDDVFEGMTSAVSPFTAVRAAGNAGLGRG